MGHRHEIKPATTATATTEPVGPAPDPAVAAAPSPTAARARLTEMAPIDFGEQVFGSEHYKEAEALWNLGEGVATLTTWIDGSSAFKLVEAPRTLVEAGRSGLDQRPVKVRFAPTAEQRDYSASLRIQAVWPDGQLALRVVPITARARPLEEIPTNGPNAVGRRAEAAQEARDRLARIEDQAVEASADRDERPVPAGAKRKFDRATRDAEIAAEALAAAQLAGVRLAERESASYQRVPSPLGFDWWSLVEVALSIGLAGVAGVVAKAFASELVKGVTGAESVRDSKAVIGIADAMKDAIKSAGKAAMRAHTPSPASASPTPASGTFSENPTINFFSAQESILLDAGKHNAQGVSERAYYLEPLLTSSPDAAVATMRAVGASLQNAASSAEIITAQALATESQWVTLIARQALGEVTVKDYNRGVIEDVHVTDLASARPTSPDSMPSTKDGVLDILMDFSPPKVVGARVTGISAEVARRFFGVSPAVLGVPIRLILGGKTDHPLVITRDEAGRVRLSGDKQLLSSVEGHDGSPLTSEEQAVGTATLLMESVIGRPLKVPIGNDDATGVSS